jgi:hypothetical protein
MNKTENIGAFHDELKHLKFEVQNKQHIVTLMDLKGYKIINGYGNTPVEALNDLHHNLL